MTGLPRFRLLIVVFLTLLAVIPQAGTASAAEGEDSWRTLKDTWQPNYIVSVARNGTTGDQSFNIAYWFNFKNMSSPFWTDPSLQGGLEIDWKNTGHALCSTGLIPGVITSPAQNVVKIGWPSNVEVRPDPYEDEGDVVAWIVDLPNLRANQLASPSKEYFIQWNCPDSASFGPVRYLDQLLRQLPKER